MLQKLTSLAKLLYRWVFFKVLLPAVYLLHALKKINPEKVLFIEHHYPTISNSSLVMYETLTAQYTFTVERCHLLGQEGSRGARARRLIAGAWQAADARVIFLSESSHLISALPMRKGTTVVQLFHACGPFKKFGFSTADRLSGDTRKNMLRFPADRHYTFVTVACEAAIEPFAEAMCLEKEKEKILPIGVSRTDVFYREDFVPRAREKLYAIAPQARGKKLLVYAPTYRGNAFDAVTADALDLQAFHDAFGSDHFLVFKNHPITKHRPVIGPACRDFAADVSEKISVEELISIADVCINDYSSWLYEAAMMEKPMVFFPHDIESYNDWHGFYQDYDAFVPGPIGRTSAALIAAIREVEKGQWAGRVLDFKQKYMRTCDGHATARILARALGEDTLRSHRKPAEKFE